MEKKSNISDECNSNSTSRSTQQYSKIPTTPALSIDSFWGGKTDISCILDVGHPIFVTSARIAIALALKLQSIGSGDEVLLPAYHCGSMVAPVEWTGAEAVFYKINPDMSASLGDIETKLTRNTRAILFPHYFGFIQPVHRISALCKSHGIVLIEDCAHTFFGCSEGEPVGSFGDYAIGSLTKFFPVVDGGCLVSRTHSLTNIQLKSGGTIFEIKSALNTLDESFNYRRSTFLNLLLGPFFISKNHLWRSIKSGRNTDELNKSPSVQSNIDRGFGFDPSWIHKRISRSSKLVMKLSSTRRAVAKRRENYLSLLRSFHDVPNCHPLHSTLPENVVPYVFPLIVDNPDPGFKELRRQGLPLLRWEFLSEKVDSSVCAQSVCYSKHLIQVPCHQELRDKEVLRIKNKIRKMFCSPESTC